MNAEVRHLKMEAEKENEIDCMQKAAAEKMQVQGDNETSDEVLDENLDSIDGMNLQRIICGVF